MDTAILRSALAADLPLTDTLLSIGWSYAYPTSGNGVVLYDETVAPVGRYTAEGAWSLLRSLADGCVLCDLRCGGECMLCDDIGTVPADLAVA